MKAGADDENAAARGRWVSPLQSSNGTLSTGDLQQEVVALCNLLASIGTRVLATLLDNSPAWVVADEAAAHGNLVHVPLPLFFSESQIAHALRAAGVETLLVPSFAAAHWPHLDGPRCTIAGKLHSRSGRPPI